MVSVSGLISELGKWTNSWLQKKASGVTPEAARIMADELGNKPDWVQTQLESYDPLAKRYLISQA